MQDIQRWLRHIATSVRALRVTAYICLLAALLLAGAGAALGKGLASQAAIASAALPLLLGLAAHIRASILDSDGPGDEWTDDAIGSAYTRACDRIYWIGSWPVVPLVYIAVLMHGRQRAKAVARAAIHRAQRRQAPGQGTSKG